MTISLIGVTVDTGVPAQNVRAPNNPVISTTGNDLQAIARQQLPSAVPAPALLAAYSTGIAPKPSSKAASSTPSSAFAAQFIAQDAGSEEDLALFEPPASPPPAQDEAAAGNDYLNDLKIARGDFSAVSKAQATPTAAAVTADTAVENANAATAQVSDSLARDGVVEQAITLPYIVSQYGRRAGLVQAKGVHAYQLAEARNAASKTATASPPPIEETAQAAS